MTKSTLRERLATTNEIVTVTELVPGAGRQPTGPGGQGWLPRMPGRRPEELTMLERPPVIIDNRLR